jgi:hypothetical protein
VPNPKFERKKERIYKQVDAMGREERKRLIRKYRDLQQGRY